LLWLGQISAELNNRENFEVQYTNDRMRTSLDANAKKKSALPTALSEILKKEFVGVGNGIFFRTFSTDSLKETVARGAFTDMSSLENSVNRFHVEDYCETEVLRAGLEFLEDFDSLWRKKFPMVACSACLTFDNKLEFGDVCTFSFFLIREGEIIFDLDRIDEFEQAILIRTIKL
jgi:hypothetical protein